MKEKIVKIFTSIFIIASNFKIVYADANINDIYNVNGNKLFTAGSYIAGWIVYIGVAAAVIMLMAKGIKFMTSAPEGKAEAKKEMIPWAVGIVILLSLKVIIEYIVKFSQENINTLTI